MFTTTAQWVVLGLVLVGGWLLGLASHPGGARWRRRYAAERDAHATTRGQAETTNRDLKARVVELERENARLASAAPVAAPVTPVDTTSPAIRPATAARPAFTAAPAGAGRGWFDWNRR